MKQELEHYETEARLALGTQHGGFIRWHDAEVGETVASVLAAETNEPVGESNLAVALDLLAQHVEAGDVWEGSVGRSGRSWLRVLTVRVLDAEGNVTPAWVDTVDLVLDPLKDYPLLDEDDYSERRHEVIAEEANDVYGDAGPLVVAALYEHGRYGPDEELHDTDAVLEAVEAELRAGYQTEPDEIEGLRFYAERAVDLELPRIRAALAAEEVEA